MGQENFLPYKTCQRKRSTLSLPPHILSLLFPEQRKISILLISILLHSRTASNNQRRTHISSSNLSPLPFPPSIAPIDPSKETRDESRQEARRLARLSLPGRALKDPSIRGTTPPLLHARGRRTPRVVFSSFNYRSIPHPHFCRMYN